MAEIVEKRSVDRVPVEERTTGFWAMFMLWAGFSISVARIWQGGLITAAGFWWAILALFIAQLLWTYIAIGAFMGASEGLPGTMIARASFGLRGRVIPSIPLIIGTIGWFGLQLGMTASALDKIVSELYGGWSLSMNVQYIIYGILMGFASIYGYKVVMFLQKFVSPLLIILIPWMIYKIFSHYDVALELNKPRETTMGVFEAITLLSGGVLALVIASADSSRYSKSTSTSVSSFLIATWSVGTPMFVIGMMGAVIVGTPDPAGITDKLGLGFLGIVIVFLAAWSTNCLNPYWGGIALSTLTTGSTWFPNGIPRAISTFLVVAVGTITAVMGIYSIGGMMTFVNVLTGTLGPANGIIIADYFFLRGKGYNRLDARELVTVKGRYWYVKGWNPVAILVWIVGVVYSTVFKHTYILITPISTQILSGILYYTLMKTAGKNLLARSQGK